MKLHRNDKESFFFFDLFDSIHKIHQKINQNASKIITHITLYQLCLNYHHPEFYSYHLCNKNSWDSRLIGQLNCSGRWHQNLSLTPIKLIRCHVHDWSFANSNKLYKLKSKSTCINRHLNENKNQALDDKFCMIRAQNILLYIEICACLVYSPLDLSDQPQYHHNRFLMVAPR